MSVDILSPGVDYYDIFPRISASPSSIGVPAMLYNGPWVKTGGSATNQLPHILIQDQGDQTHNSSPIELDPTGSGLGIAARSDFTGTPLFVSRGGLNVFGVRANGAAGLRSFPNGSNGNNWPSAVQALYVPYVSSLDSALDSTVALAYIGSSIAGNNMTGLLAQTDGGVGITGTTNAGTGVRGSATTGVGISGQSVSGPPLYGLVLDTATNTAPFGLIVDHATSGSPTTGFGVSIGLRSSDATTTGQTIGFLNALWVSATHTALRGRVSIWASDNTASREGIRVETNGTAATLGFYGVNAISRQAAPAASTDLASVITLANGMRTILIALGLLS